MTRVETIVGNFKQPNGKPGFTLRIPEEARCLFPPNGNRYTNLFVVRSAGNSDSVWISKRHSPRQLDHIHITGTKWWKKLNSKPPVRAVVVIEVTESKDNKEYRIR
jgi:hypothetical protein